MTTTTTMKAAILKAAKAKAATTQAPAVVVQPKPLVTLETGQWLKGALVKGLREKYRKDVEAGQRGADALVQAGMVRIPHGTALVAIPIRAFGGELGFVVNPIGDTGWTGSKAKLDLSFLPD